MFDFLKRKKEIYLVLEFRNDDTFSVSAHKTMKNAKACMAAKVILTHDDNLCNGKYDSEIKRVAEDIALVKWDGGSQNYTYQIVKSPLFR